MRCKDSHGLWTRLRQQGWRRWGLIGLLLLSLVAFVYERRGRPLQPQAPQHAASGALECPGASATSMPRAQEYLALKARTWAWLDQLEVNPILLRQNGVKGKKKLAEILQGYVSLARYARDVAAQARIQQRVTDLANYTQQADYHDMGVTSDTDFLQNSMSYLRVLELLAYLGHDTASYREHVRTIQPRLDAHLPQRGPWQRAMFALYYTRLGLEKPPVLLASVPGIIHERFPPAQYDQDRAYMLTHEVFVAFDYGARRQQEDFTADDLAYLRQILPVLAYTALSRFDADLLAETLLCMLYLGWHTTPLYCQGLHYLLDHQNANGTWGNYDAWRAPDDTYFEQRVYLHTTVVALQALIETYEGHWPVSHK